jgi:DNA-binding transcriptional regulator of glucitol operon
MEITGDRLSMIIIAVVVIVASSLLAWQQVAPWQDVYTIMLIVLAGMGFVSAGYSAGEARAYKTELQTLKLKELAADKTKTSA